MALEDVHLDILQNIEFAIVNVYHRQRDLRDVQVMRALDADITLPEPEQTVFQRTKDMCDFRLGRPGVATRLQVPFEGEKTVHDILACLRKIRKSVERWNKRGGQQGYLHFVQEFVR